MMSMDLYEKGNKVYIYMEFIYFMFILLWLYIEDNRKGK